MEGHLVITPTQVEAACREGFDGMSKLVTKLLGAEAWLRMVSHSKYSKYSSIVSIAGGVAPYGEP